MRKEIDFYCDFETTILPPKYKDEKDYKEINGTPFNTNIYAWNIKYERPDSQKEYFGKENYKVKINEKEKLVDIYGISGQSFIDTILTLNADAIMWFHNLKNFDGHFILYLLEQNNFIPFINDKMLSSTLKQELDTEEDKLIFKKLQERNRFRRSEWKKILWEDPNINKVYDEIWEEKGNKKADNWFNWQLNKKLNMLLPFEYKATINDNKAIYKIEIGLPTFKKTNGVKKYRRLLIKDSLLLFATSIKKMGKTLQKTFPNTKKFNKLTLDDGYTREAMYKSFEEFENDGNQLEYLLQDTYILFNFLKLMENKLPRKYWKLTSASTAYSYWENMLGKKIWNQIHINNKDLKVKSVWGVDYFIDGRGKKKKVNEKYKECINNILPTKWLDEYTDRGIKIHTDMYNFYDGGLTMVNEDYRGKMLSNISVYDINSSYPSQMIKNKNFPIGEPILGDTKNKDYDYKLYEITFKKTIENKRGMPFLYNALTSKREYCKKFKFGEKVYIDTFEFEEMKKRYNFNPEEHFVNVKYSFKTLKGYEIFGDYVNYWYKLKEQAKKDGDDGLATIAKLFLNCLYGKMGTKSIRESKYRVNGNWFNMEEELKSKFYLPLAIAITSLARLQLEETIDNNYDKFVYCDTDSLFIKDFNINQFPNMELDKNKLGAWDCEYENMVGVVRRAKQYLFKKPKKLWAPDSVLKNNIKIGFAGINLDRATLSDKEKDVYDKNLDKWLDLTFNLFLSGDLIGNQLTTRKIESGVILIPIDKEIKPVWDETYEKLVYQSRFKKEHFEEDLKLANFYDKKINMI